VVPTSLEACRALVRKGLRDGKAVQFPGNGNRWQVQYMMDCLAPHSRTLVARYSHGKSRRRVTVQALYRCRQCEACMDSNARYWMGRAGTEFRMAARTYMGTFTLRPAELALLDAKVARTVAIAKLDQNELFAERARAFGELLDDYLNRVRAGAHWRANIRNGAFRYLLVAERHDGVETDEWMRGRPHFHILLHEQEIGALVIGDPLALVRPGDVNGEFELRVKKFDAGQPVTGVFLTDNSMVRLPWNFGFTKFEWCYSEASAVYVCKYLTKSNAYRVRASIRYGKLQPGEILAKPPADEGGANPSTPPGSESEKQWHG